MKKTFIIAEVAQAHDGSLGILHSYIDAFAETGIDAVKFQTHIAEAESSIYEPFRVNFSYVDKTRFDYWKRMEFSKRQWKEIKDHCEEVNLEFISSPFSNKAVDLLEELDVKRYKVGSGEINNFLLLEKIAKTGKPIIISSGMSSISEISEALKFLDSFGNDVSLLQCTTSYPTRPGQWGIELIPELKKKFNIPIGFSDHSGITHSSIAAVALGAEILEFHAVFNKKMFGPDAKASLNLKQTQCLVAAVRDLEKEFATKYKKEINEELGGLKTMFEKSLSINKNLSKGDIISFEDLEAKKPKGYGINAKEFRKVIGKGIKEDKQKWDFLNWEDLI
jgi:N,N'-diacetyllegionaminate synthase